MIAIKILPTTSIGNEYIKKLESNLRIPEVESKRLVEEIEKYLSGEKS